MSNLITVSNSVKDTVVEEMKIATDQERQITLSSAEVLKLWGATLRGPRKLYWGGGARKFKNLYCI
jgi:hypothetical protein